MVQPFEIIYTIEDENGGTATTSVFVPTTFALTDYVEFAAQLATLKDDFIFGRVRDASICAQADVSALTSNLLDLSSDVEEIAAFKFRTTQNDIVSINIPGLAESLVSGEDSLAGATISAFITAIEDGITTGSGTIVPIDVGGIDIDQLQQVRARFRASGTRRVD